MIELGKYGTTFVIHSSYWYNKPDKDNLKQYNSVWYEGRICRITNIYEDSICLVLQTNDSNSCIEII
jgi:hypothetical protein